MDYEFRKDLFLGEYHADFSMEHQIVGRWLESEIGTDRTKIDHALSMLKKAQDAPFRTLNLLGREVSIIIHDGEVTIQENVLGMADVDELEENFSIYESESSSQCGLEDFNAMLVQWAEFVTSR